MGLWLKQDDGSLVPVGGGGSGGGEVLTGDPFDPPADWAVGQLLYDGWEDTGDGSEPHDHDYLPLTGGTVTGDLAVDGTLKADGNITGSLMNLTGGVPDTPALVYASQLEGRKILALESQQDRTGAASLLLYGSGDLGGKALMYGGGFRNQEWYDGLTRIFGDLQVDGKIDVGPTKEINFGQSSVDGQQVKVYDGTGGTYGIGVADRRASIFAGSQEVAGFYNDLSTKLLGDLQVDGRIQAFTGVSPDDPAIKFDAGTGMYRKGTHQIGFAVNGVLVATINSGGVTGRIAFNIADGIDTSDVLDRAETATMPALDDEGVATMDADVEGLSVNEVVTAMLAKIKELSAEIEELKGA